MTELLQLLPEYLRSHLELTVGSLVLALLVSVPLGVFATRVEWLKQVTMSTAGAIQTIPALALLAVMVPVLSAVGLQAIGVLPAMVGLTLYCVFPLLLGTIVGISEVDPAMVEAARAVGMTPSQRLRRVEIPLAMPTILSYVRTATVWCVGLATLSTPVGATSLGNYIFSGLQTLNFRAVLVGCVAAALLAQLLDRLWQIFEYAYRQRKRRLLQVVLTVFAGLGLFTGGSFASALWSDDDVLLVGSKPFTEQYILSELITQHVRATADVPTKRLESLGSTVAFDALRAGQLDILVEYTGTIWANVMHRRDNPGRKAVLRAVTTHLADSYGIEVAAVLGFENAYALAMRADHAETLGVVKVSDLVVHAPRLAVGGDYEFFSRPEWEDLAEGYALSFREQRSMDPALMYQAVKEGEVDAIGAYTTDGRIAAYDLRVLDDDRGVIPPYDAIILTSARLVRDHPDVVRRLAKLEQVLDDGSMRALNLAVDFQGEAPARVAARVLRDVKSR